MQRKFGPLLPQDPGLQESRRLWWCGTELGVRFACPGPGVWVVPFSRRCWRFFRIFRTRSQRREALSQGTLQFRGSCELVLFSPHSLEKVECRVSLSLWCWYSAVACLFGPFSALAKFTRAAAPQNNRQLRFSRKSKGQVSYPGLHSISSE